MSRDPQTDNTDPQLKLAVRRWVAERVPKPWAVLDLYCGAEGHMYRGIWHQAETYLGTDKKEPHKLAPTLKVSAEVAVQELPLADYNIFDIDPYTSPWVVARRVLRGRFGGPFGLILTSGKFRGLCNSHANEIIRTSIGARGLSDYRLLSRYQDLVVLLMVRSLAEIRGVKLLKAVQAETDRHIVYLGLIARNDRGAQSKHSESKRGKKRTRKQDEQAEDPGPGA